jgi:inorganic pyrophosphatase
MVDLGTNSKGFKLQGRLNIQGLPVAVENQKGSVREGKNDDGSTWKTKFKKPYGYIEGTKGADGEEVDAYVGPDEGSTKAFVVEQKKDDGSYDEDTVMLGFKSKAEAVKAIKQHYDDPKYIGKTRAVPVERLKKELKVKTAGKGSGFYKGQPASPDTVKFKTEFRGIPINVDRPRGFIMKGTDSKGNEWARRYRYHYGFIPKTLGGDGDGLDVFIGPLKSATYAYWVVQRKDDGSFDEYKVFLGFPDRDAATAAYRQHIPKKFFKGIITMKVEMMKAMLGKVNPDEKMKRASVAAAFADELGWLMRTSA